MYGALCSVPAILHCQHGSSDILPALLKSPYSHLIAARPGKRYPLKRCIEVWSDPPDLHCCLLVAHTSSRHSHEYAGEVATPSHIGACAASSMDDSIVHAISLRSVQLPVVPEAG
ncbi:hypothetical protein FA95DRAFT_1565916 [Auriscalpium vulgare]|uniref:Uncharacterized protein n=1 Tax=Auriscalpium vulgare TaxID=40419 RepID=A0ACB8RAL4_9AGAM|nr:hypothetical protein FA95DRAFT_1565916 [Auriscalpium vulgare]